MNTPPDQDRSDADIESVPDRSLFQVPAGVSHSPAMLDLYVRLLLVSRRRIEREIVALAYYQQRQLTDVAGTLNLTAAKVADIARSILARERHARGLADREKRLHKLFDKEAVKTRRKG